MKKCDALLFVNLCNYYVLHYRHRLCARHLITLMGNKRTGPEVHKNKNIADDSNEQNKMKKVVWERKKAT